MPTLDVRFRRHLLDFTLAFACLFAFFGCSEDQAPTPLPAAVEIVAGNAQYTRKGSGLEDPVVIRVRLEDGAPATGVIVNFQVIEGGGSLSHTTATTSSNGRASVRWTLGPDVGSNRLRITVPDNSALSTIATATASEYFCVEEDPAFAQEFFPTHDLMLFTHSSSLVPAAAGLVKFHPNFNNHTVGGANFNSYPEGTFIYVVRDCVFSANGDLFVSWNHLHSEIARVASDGSVSHFAALDPNSAFGSEIAMTPEGALVGCDEFGPFVVTCRDTLFRFEDSTFSGINRDATNNDAVACDPTSGDLYFIYKSDRTLRRIPLDGTTQTGPIEEVVTLPIDESDGARGMVVDGTDGSVYILVQSAGTKSIVKVTPAGVRSTEFDLTTLYDPPAAPGNYSDLAIDRGFRFLYTLDTAHNLIVIYDIVQQTASELIPTGDPGEASNDNVGERVGLDVIPGP